MRGRVKRKEAREIKRAVERKGGKIKKKEKKGGREEVSEGGKEKGDVEMTGAGR